MKLELADLSQRNADSTLLEDLQHLAALGETLCDQRKRYKIDAGIADALDREGRFILPSVCAQSRASAQVSIFGTSLGSQWMDQEVMKIDVCSLHVSTITPLLLFSWVHGSLLPTTSVIVWARRSDTFCTSLFRGMYLSIHTYISQTGWFPPDWSGYWAEARYRMWVFLDMISNSQWFSWEYLNLRTSWIHQTF